MTDPIRPTPHGSELSEARTSGAVMPQAGPAGQGDPPPVRGRTTIADGVVEKIAAMAARGVPGVHELGGGLARTFGAMREKVPGGHANIARGVRAEVGEKQTAIDLEVVVEYGVSIPEAAADVRENVIAALERMTGLEVVEVNISVNDVYLPDEDAAQTTEERVR